MKPFESGPVCRSGALFTRAVQASRKKRIKIPFMLDLHYQPIQQISVWQNFSLFVMLSFYVEHKAAFFCIIVTANTAFKAAFLMNSSHVALQVESTGSLMTTRFTHKPYSFVHSLNVSFQSPLRARFVITHLTKILCLAMHALLVLFN